MAEPAEEYFDWDMGRAPARPVRLSAEQRDFVRRHLQASLPAQVLDYFSLDATRTERIAAALREALKRPGYPKSAEYPLPPALTPDYLREVQDDVVGLGPLESLLRDSDVTSINVIAWDVILVERGRVRERHAETFRDQAHLAQVAENLALLTHHTLSKASPRVTAFVTSVGVRTRMHLDSTSVSGPYIGFRRGRGKAWPLDELVRRGALSGEVAVLLANLARAEVPLIVVGPPGAGKTTVLEALIRELPRRHLVIIEDGVHELSPEHPFVTHIVIPPTADVTSGHTAGDMAEAAKSALRKNCDQVVYGEILDGNAGHVIANASSFRWSATTLHGDTVDAALARFARLAQLDNTRPRSPYVGVEAGQVRADIALTFRAVVLVGRLADGRQVVREVAWLDGLDAAGAWRVRRLAWVEQTATATGVQATWCVAEGFTLPEPYALSLTVTEHFAEELEPASLAEHPAFQQALAAVRHGDAERALGGVLESLSFAGGPVSTLPLEVQTVLRRVLRQTGLWAELDQQAHVVEQVLSQLVARRAWHKLEVALGALEQSVPLGLVLRERTREWQRVAARGRAEDAQVQALVERVQAASRADVVRALEQALSAPMPVALAPALYAAVAARYAEVAAELTYGQAAWLSAQLVGLARLAGVAAEVPALTRTPVEAVRAGTQETVAQVQALSEEGAR